MSEIPAYNRLAGRIVTTRRLRMAASVNRRFLVLVEGICLVLALQGCSWVIAGQPRIGPNPDRDFKVGTSRADVERALGTPITSETLADGRVKALYEYTVRGPVASDTARYVVECQIRTVGFCDLIGLGIPMLFAYFDRPKNTYQKEYIYGLDDTIVESSPEPPKPSTSERPGDSEDPDFRVP